MSKPAQSKNSATKDAKVVVVTKAVEKGEDDADLKTDPVIVGPALNVSPLLKQILSAGRAKGGKKGLPELKIVSWLPETTSNSTAATAQAPTIALDVTQISEWATLISLYDECIVDGFECHFSIQAAGGTPSYIHLGVSYDPVDSTAYGALTTLLSSFKKMGPLGVYCGSGSTNQLNCPAPSSKTGMFRFNGKIPKGKQAVAGGASYSAQEQQTVTGNWMATNPSVAHGYYGWLKWYIEAPGTSVVSTLFAFVGLHMRFRCRT